MNRKELNEYYQRAAAEGKTVNEVADELLTSEAAVRLYCKAHGIELRKAGNVGSGDRRKAKWLK